MLYITSFFRAPRGVPIYSIANSAPRDITIAGRINIFVPPWPLVQEFKCSKQGWPEWDRFATAYNAWLEQHWAAVEEWAQKLPAHPNMTLCCWEQQGACHRFLVAEVIRRLRPDLIAQLDVA